MRKLHDGDLVVVAICLAITAGVLIGSVTAIWIMSGLLGQAVLKVP